MSALQWAEDEVRAWIREHGTEGIKLTKLTSLDRGILAGCLVQFAARKLMSPDPIPMLLWCPMCGARHIDEGEFATKPHHTHACQTCGLPWRPALVPTCGVQFLPGYKNMPPVCKNKGRRGPCDCYVCIPPKVKP